MSLYLHNGELNFSVPEFISGHFSVYEYGCSLIPGLNFLAKYVLGMGPRKDNMNTRIVLRN